MEALIDPISYMKQQLRELLDDLPEEEKDLAMHNPNVKVQCIFCVYHIYLYLYSMSLLIQPVLGYAA